MSQKNSIVLRYAIQTASIIVNASTPTRPKRRYRHQPEITSVGRSTFASGKGHRRFRSARSEMITATIATAIQTRRKAAIEPEQIEQSRGCRQRDHDHEVWPSLPSDATPTEESKACVARSLPNQEKAFSTFDVGC